MVMRPMSHLDRLPGTSTITEVHCEHAWSCLFICFLVRPSKRPKRVLMWELRSDLRLSTLSIRLYVTDDQHGQMTDLLDVLPTFPTAQYTHLLPSLERNFVTTSDLLTLDGIELAKRAQLPLLDVKRLIVHVLASLHAELGVKDAGNADKKFEGLLREGEEGWGKLRTGGEKLLARTWRTTSLGDEALDGILNGGIPTGYLTEIVGERYSSTCIVLDH